jgi:hypothetical protein
MSRYYLNIRWDGQNEDLEGEEFLTLAAAREEAILSIREIVADDVRNGKGLFLTRRLAILDENQKAVEELMFSDIILLDDSGHGLGNGDHSNVQLA